jgi:hypothetical protein
MTLTLEPIPQQLWVSQLDGIDLGLVADVTGESGEFWTLSKTADELSLVSSIESHPNFLKSEGPWAGFRIAGQLDFALTGILSTVSAVLAAAKISVFAISTYDTDYFLVPAASREDAVAAWRAAGLTVTEGVGQL